MGTRSGEFYIEVSVSWPGAEAEAVDEHVLRTIETAHANLEGLNRISGIAENGTARMLLIFKSRAQDDDWETETVQAVKRQLETITTLPYGTEDPQVTIISK